MAEAQQQTHASSTSPVEPKASTGGAWQCFFTIIAFEAALNLLGHATKGSAFLISHRDGIAKAEKLLTATVWLVSAYLWSRAGSAQAFFREMGLSKSRPLMSWIFAWTGVGLGLVALYASRRGLTTPNFELGRVWTRGGSYLYFYVFFVCAVGPFYEETIFRGFLFHRFRQRYGFWLGVILSTAASLYFHFGALLHFNFGSVSLILIWVLACFARERTGNTWSSVLVHAGYNAAQVLAWPCYVGFLVLLFPVICMQRRGRATPEDLHGNPPIKPACPGQNGPKGIVS